MERIGRYEILRELGRGGYGRVYLARDPLMKCEVAIKVMSNADDPDMLARFRDEAAAARKLRHESIVTIYDVGEMQGVPYIVMEYLQGMDLQKIRDQNQQLSLVQKVRILSQVAAGLQVAHENGIIHRDVKPANIMLLKDGSIKIMDFGIARLTRDGATHHTRTGVLVGTLQYISPEQFEGHVVDTMADLWAFGVIAFQMFAGKNPFEAAETVQVIYNITSLPAPILQQINPEAPEGLCQLVRKLLMRDRAARYQSFEDVRLDLNPLLEGLEAQEADRLVDDARMKAARGDLQTAHQMVRQVLERYPSNTQAKQIRDHIVTQIRASEVTRQVEELLKKGDRDFSAGIYEEALTSYQQACRLSPGSSTARMRLDRAQKMAERVRRIRDEMNEARARLAAGDPKEAERILAEVLADDPDNTGAPDLLIAARQERGRQEEAARADAILYARHLITQHQFAEATDALAACARNVGNHGDLQQATEEVRRAETTAAAQVRIEGAIAKANQHLGQGEFAAASGILAPVAAEFPANTDLKELVKFVAQEEARVRRVTEQLASLQNQAGPELLPAPPPQPAQPRRTKVIERALEMSSKHERGGQIAGAVHVLDVALSRYPDAAELVNERLRLMAPKPIPPASASELAAAAPRQILVPTLPESQEADVGRIRVAEPSAHAPLNRRVLWAGGAAAILICVGMGYRLLTKPSPPAPSNNPRAPQQGAAKQPATQSAVESTRPSPPVSTAPATSPAPVTTLPVEAPVKKSGPSLASLLPPVYFVYHKGDLLSEKVLKADRSPLHAVVTSYARRRPGEGWLVASASDGRVVLSLDAAIVASLPIGSYGASVQVTSNQEEARLDVELRLQAERPAVKMDPKQVPATPSSPPLAPNPDSSKTSVATPVPAVRWNGPNRGQATWNGSLPAGARLVLGESGVLEGGGKLMPEIYPPDVQFDVTFPQGLGTLLPTGAQRVVITNSTGGQVSLIRFTWSRKSIK